MSIMGILISIAIAGAGAAKATARDNQRTTDIKLLQLKLENYRDIHGVYPATLQALVTDNLIPSVPVPPPSGAETSYKYAGVKISGDSTNTCVGYHLGITFEANRSALSNRAGKAPYSGLECGGSASDTIDGSQVGSKVYDVVSPDMI
jgi:type II secretory pathway pseudopilin PulG